MTTILKLYSNGDFESLVPLTRSGIEGNYEFKEDGITVPSIVRYSGNDEGWIKDTGNPISFFSEGVVIKGELIAPNNNTTLFFDDFNRPDSNSLGGDWEITSGSYSISNNMARNLPFHNDDSIALVDVGTQDNIRISLGVFQPNEYDGITFRTVDSDRSMTAVYFNGNIQVNIDNYNDYVTLARATVTVAEGQSINLAVELRGEEIKVFVNHELIITTTSSYFMTATKCGMLAYTSNGKTAVYDDFRVETLSI